MKLPDGSAIPKGQLGVAEVEAARDEKRVRRAVPPGASLRVLSGFYADLELPLDRDWLVVGRGRSADWLLADATLSRAHAAFGFEGGSFYVQDLGSTNGTFVNGRRCERAPLRGGDEIQLGKLRLRFERGSKR